MLYLYSFDYIFIGVVIVLFILIKKIINNTKNIKSDFTKLESKLDEIVSVLKKSDKQSLTKEDLSHLLNLTLSDNKKEDKESIIKDTVVDDIPIKLEDVIAEELIVNTVEEKQVVEEEKLNIPIVEEEIKEEVNIETDSILAKYFNSESSEKIEEKKVEVFASTESATSDIKTNKQAYKGKTIRANSSGGSNTSNNGESILGKLFNENLLPKIGILTFVLGIAFFVKYAIDKEWINEIGRVGIGIATGALLAGIAHYLRTKYHTFSSLLMGGGIAIFYITITLAFREYELMSQTVAFALLIVITIFAVIFSLLYDRQELAVISLLGGFASPLLVSTGEGNYIVLFSYLFILNTGLLLISLRKRWNIVCILSFVFTLIFYWSWLFMKFSIDGEGYKFITGAMIFGSLFYIQFYALSIIRSLANAKKIRALEIIFIVVNNLSMVLASLYILEERWDIKGLVIIALAVVNAAIMIVLYKKFSVDKNIIYTILAVVVSLVSLAIPIQLDGYVITMFWAVEIAVLTWMWSKTRIRIFNIGIYFLIILTFFSYVIDIERGYSYFLDDEPMSIIFNKMFLSGVVIIGSLFMSYFLIRKDEEDGELKIRRILLVVLLFLSTFFVPFLELSYQLDMRSVYPDYYNFNRFVLSIYCIVYLSSVVVLFRKQIKAVYFPLFFVLLAILTLSYSFNVSMVEQYIYSSTEFGKAALNLHWIAFIGVAATIYCLITRMKHIKALNVTLFAYLLTILGVFMLSITTDSVALSLFGEGNYDNVLSDCHTFVYPIVWGLVAFVLMLFGIRTKEVILRKISLVFFGLIIAKFYIYDIWRMSQFGRVLSFVALGIILLLVSFLLQKIKKLIKTDDVEELENNDNNDK